MGGRGEGWGERSGWREPPTWAEHVPEVGHPARESELGHPESLARARALGAPERLSHLENIRTRPGLHVPELGGPATQARVQALGSPERISLLSPARLSHLENLPRGSGAVGRGVVSDSFFTDLDGVLEDLPPPAASPLHAGSLAGSPQPKGGGHVGYEALGEGNVEGGGASDVEGAPKGGGRAGSPAAYSQPERAALQHAEARQNRGSEAGYEARGAGNVEGEAAPHVEEALPTPAWQGEGCMEGGVRSSAACTRESVTLHSPLQNLPRDDRQNPEGAWTSQAPPEEGGISYERGTPVHTGGAVSYERGTPVSPTPERSGWRNALSGRGGAHAYRTSEIPDDRTLEFPDNRTSDFPAESPPHPGRHSEEGGAETARTPGGWGGDSTLFELSASLCGSAARGGGGLMSEAPLCRGALRSLRMGRAS